MAEHQLLVGVHRRAARFCVIAPSARARRDVQPDGHPTKPLHVIERWQLRRRLVYLVLGLAADWEVDPRAATVLALFPALQSTQHLRRLLHIRVRCVNSKLGQGSVLMNRTIHARMNAFANPHRSPSVFFVRTTHVLSRIHPN